MKKDCIKDGRDVCFVEKALDAHNKYRSKHRGGEPLVEYSAASKFIQDALNTAGSTFDGTISNRETLFTECSMNVYEETQEGEDNIKAVFDTDIATDSWYSGQQYYDYNSGRT